TRVLSHENPVKPIVDELPSLLPCFSVPLLANKPQNPILESIELESRNVNDQIYSHANSSPFPPSGHQYSMLHDMKKFGSSRLNNDGSQNRRNLMSWDSLRRDDMQMSHSPFLSEQSSQSAASIQHHIQPVLSNSRVASVHIEETVLLDALQMTVLGTSSLLHTWESASEAFVQNNRVVIEGKNQIVIESFIRRFLTIGTLLRRLEIFVDNLRSRHTSGSPTIHAFSHALSSTLKHLRDNLIIAPLSNVAGFTDATTWLHYGIFEELVTSIASLCDRDIDYHPTAYTNSSILAVPLLSRLYDSLKNHFERSSPQVVIAIHAYLLTVSSRGYIERLCLSIAYGGRDYRRTQKVANTIEAEALFDGNGDVNVSSDELDDNETEEDSYPSFVPNELANVLSAATKSLKLLTAAKPDHLILHSSTSTHPILWLWTEREINEASGFICDVKEDNFSPNNQHLSHSPVAVNNLASKYKADLIGFQAFDMEPGSLGNQDHATDMSPTTALRDFIASFPDSLPPVTSNFATLSSLVFSPLITHAASLSRALLSLFLEQDSALCLHTHLVLLRSHMLLTSHSFKSRLSAALFSDSDDREVSDHSLKAFTMSRQKIHSNGIKPSQTGRWAVGLAPFLTDRDVWPPGGADLSYFLRTVIVDSLESTRAFSYDASDNSDGLRHILSEAEFRLGFAIRDLPTGIGRDRWLDPLCKALDFLYIDYKVPHPLEVIISPGTLSKYQRVFAFLLRMLRVEAAIRATYRMTRNQHDLLFPTFASSNKRLLHFRFVVHSFVDALSSYIFGTAIGGNFDVFLSRIQTPAPDTSDDFSDVFSLANSHSALLDDILSACLLRSSQRVVGDLLRSALELVLEFCVFVGDIKLSRLPEYRAISALELLYESFYKKMTAFIKSLETLMEKDTMSWRHQEATFIGHESGVHRPPGGLESLHHLLVRLDIGDWWKNAEVDTNRN
ncbi:Spc98 family-domain-containing protein, partial [Hygrophoropsis aurantiaca]